MRYARTPPVPAPSPRQPGVWKALAWCLSCEGGEEVRSTLRSPPPAPYASRHHQRIFPKLGQLEFSGKGK